MPNKLFLSFILSVLLATTYSQKDTLYLYDGKIIPIKLIKVNFNDVSYLQDSIPQNTAFNKIKKLTLSNGKFIIFKRFETDTHKLYKNQVSLNLVDCIINRASISYNRLFRNNRFSVGAFFSFKRINTSFFDHDDDYGDIRRNKTFESDYLMNRDFSFGFMGNIYFKKGRNSGAYAGLTSEFGKFSYAYTNGNPPPPYYFDDRNFSVKRDYYTGTCIHIGFNANLSRQVFFGMRGGAGYGYFHTIFGLHSYIPYVAEIKLGFRW